MIITIMIIRIAVMMMMIIIIITVDLQDQKSVQHENSCCDLCFHLIV